MRQLIGLLGDGASWPLELQKLRLRRVLEVIARLDPGLGAVLSIHSAKALSALSRSPCCRNLRYLTLPPGFRGSTVAPLLPLLPGLQTLEAPELREAAALLEAIARDPTARTTLRVLVLPNSPGAVSFWDAAPPLPLALRGLEYLDISSTAGAQQLGIRALEHLLHLARGGGRLRAAKLSGLRLAQPSKSQPLLESLRDSLARLDPPLAEGASSAMHDPLVSALPGPA